MTSQFHTEVRIVDPKTGVVDHAGDAGVDSMVGTLNELNAVHSTRGQTPLTRWDRGWTNRKPVGTDRRCRSVPLVRDPHGDKVSDGVIGGQQVSS